MSVLVVAAHPDDETVGAGIWLRRQRAADVHILHITDGSPRDMLDARALGFASHEAYASARRRELAEALRMAGIPETNCAQFLFPDKEAHLNLPDLIAQLDALIGALRPDRVLSPAYEGGHPDHDTAAFAVAVVRHIRRSFEHYEFPLYHAGPNGQLITGEFISDGHPREQEILLFSNTERTLKHQMYACFATQRQILSQLLSNSECFRQAPEYDFTRPPHPGLLLYEQWDWGISGTEWRAQTMKVKHA